MKVGTHQPAVRSMIQANDKSADVRLIMAKVFYSRSNNSEPNGEETEKQRSREKKEALKYGPDAQSEGCSAQKSVYWPITSTVRS